MCSNHHQTIRVKSQSNVPAVVSFDSTIKEFGVSVQPEVFRLTSSGEVMDVKVTLNPPAPRSYQGMFLVFNVRGGRNLRIPLHAESVVPDVAMEQAGFEFGGVALGGDMSLPMTVMNKGNIAASLILDLTQYDGFSINTAPDAIKVRRSERRGEEPPIKSCPCKDWHRRSCFAVA